LSKGWYLPVPEYPVKLAAARLAVVVDVSGWSFRQVAVLACRSQKMAALLDKEFFLNCETSLQDRLSFMLGKFSNSGHIASGKSAQTNATASCYAGKASKGQLTMQIRAVQR
jgi:hypothetical protein